MTWLELYGRAFEASDAAAGYYNRNVGLLTAGGKVNVRIPLAAADTMDLRLWREEQVLACIRPYVGRVPELRHVCDEPRFQVHHFIEGRVLDSFSPRGSSVPANVLADVVTLMDQLVRIPQEKAPELPAHWPAYGDSGGFGRLLAGLTHQVHSTYVDEYREAFSELGIPADPLAVIEPLWDTLTPRPFALLHADLHRKNMIVTDDATWFLDWELALWGDPMYEIGIHFHKMDYPEDQRADVFRQWRERLPAQFTTGPLDDLDLYMAHERIKSAIVDTVRYSKQLAAAARPEREFLIGRLAKKVNAALRVWGSPPDLTPERVAVTLAPWWKG
ncbi:MULTISPECIES: phosphotransferase family protein [unclassified Streptomyces]|uniref:phosphotransferase family protein n=1 Tax=unclassified Streptomyces TaxID=2593676 RepID=UPI001BEABDCE|nr:MULTISPECIES: aminoglycoside phosphotransferase family protein [unclassified Streptomyces]MBT2403347.1 phosphotransferase [Streptomyces sp. ISL-21]MBT2453774.1 phosphotransferase [Streptomyces sp. ISL-86]MBT2613614.1 phosphotransferase [Streptomyces sp. ISL-87]